MISFGSEEQVKLRKRGRPLRILVLPSHLGFGGKGGFGTSGAGVFFRDQALALARAGHDVSVLYVHFDNPRGITINQVKEDKATFLFVHARPLPFRANSLYRMALILAAYAKYFGESPPDIIHAHNVKAGRDALLVATFDRRPRTILTEHSPKVKEDERNTWKLSLRRVVYNRMDALISVSDGLAQEMKRLVSRPVFVVPNLVTNTFFGPLDPHAQMTPFRFLSIGKSTENKGWDTLIHAFAGIIKGGVNATLTLVGGGDRHQILEHLCAELGISEHVRFSGRVDHDEVRRMIGASHCHVMPSRIETFGVASIEALAAGKPIIMTRTFAADTIVRDFNGLSVPVEDRRSLCQAMEHMVHNWTRYDSQLIQADCFERFSASRVVAQLERVYESACGSPRSSAQEVLLRRIVARPIEALHSCHLHAASHGKRLGTEALSDARPSTEGRVS